MRRETVLPLVEASEEFFSEAIPPCMKSGLPSADEFSLSLFVLTMREKGFSLGRGADSCGVFCAATDIAKFYYSH